MSENKNIQTIETQIEPKNSIVPVSQKLKNSLDLNRFFVDSEIDPKGAEIDNIELEGPEFDVMELLQDADTKAKLELQLTNQLTKIRSEVKKNKQNTVVPFTRKIQN